MSPPITEEQIESLVHTFYERVRDDELLGPVFESRLSDRWDAHLQRMCDFWSSVLLASRRFYGNPMEAHTDLPVGRAHFDRWITLFEATARDTLPEHLALDVAGRASRMRMAIERSVAGACPSGRVPRAS